MDFLVLLQQMHLDSMEHPYALLLIVLLPLYVFLVHRKATVAFPSIILPTVGHQDLHARDQGRYSWKLIRRQIPLLLRSRRFYMCVLSGLLNAASFICLTIAIAHPYGDVTSDTKTEGIDIYFAVDMSASMQAYDYSLDEMNANARLHIDVPNRFEEAKTTILEFIESRAAQCHNHTKAIARCDRIGITMFAEQAFVDVPLTTGYEILTDHMTKRHIDDIRATQSAIGDGILSAVASLRHSRAKSKNVILVSDGDSNGGRVSISQAIQAAQNYEVRVFPIIIGKGDQAVYATQDAWGNPTFREATYPVNFSLLEHVASETHGHAYRASNEQAFLARLQDILDQLDTHVTSDVRRDYQMDLSQHFVMLAFLFALFSMFVYSLFAKEFP